MLIETIGVVLCGGVGLWWMFPWIPADLRMLWATIGISIKIAGKIVKKRFVIDDFEYNARNDGDKVFLRYSDETYTYSQMNAMATKAARALQELGVKTGQTVAVVIENEPAYVWTYLALLKLGVRIACINVNLRSRSLEHCLKTSDAKICLVGNDPQLLEAVQDIKANICHMRIFSFESKPEHLMFESFQNIVDRMSSDEIDPTIRAGLTMQDGVALVFTSGTTGLPKAAIVTNLKLTRGSFILYFGNCNKDDVIYVTMPLYHASALVLSLGNAIRVGGTVALRRKFSASNFWSDCRKYDATIVFYIGELCRYLLARPPSGDDGKHSIRMACGNGLRPDIWTEFVNRFKIPRVLEFYAATECPVGFMNIDNVMGSLGRVSPLTRIIYKAYFLKFDTTTEAPYRNEQGFCEQSKLGDVGLLVIRRTNFTPFDGYFNNEKESQRKLLFDIFKKGDVFINAGDLFRVDSNYNLYFNDRIGDTFRWKGENVSTTEVSNVLCDMPFVTDASVYGVTAPGGDGRAGMAAIALLDGSTSLSREQMSEVFRHCSDLLPNYAIPRFLRVEKELTVTGTFKLIKTQFVKDGFDIQSLPHGAYFLDTATKSYISMSDTVYKEILDGTRKL